MTCDYCGGRVKRVTGDVIYPHRPDLAHKRFWSCEPCAAYVGCHPNGKPLGRLANAELRQAKMRAHYAFDPLWKSGGMTRSAAYAHLASLLNLPLDECHIGMFDVAMCERVVLVLSPHQPPPPPETPT